MNDIEARSARRAWRRTASRGAAQDEIVQGIKSFALYGFPESHAASFALLAYASALPEGAPPGGVLRARCSTTGRWASITRRRWSPTPPATASSVRPIDVTRSGWLCDARGRRPARCGWACATCAGLREAVGDAASRPRAAQRAVRVAGRLRSARARRAPPSWRRWPRSARWRALGARTRRRRRCGRSRRSAARARCSARDRADDRAGATRRCPR